VTALGANWEFTVAFPRNASTLISSKLHCDKVLPNLDRRDAVGVANMIDNIRRQSSFGLRTTFTLICCIAILSVGVVQISSKWYSGMRAPNNVVQLRPEFDAIDRDMRSRGFARASDGFAESVLPIRKGMEYAIYITEDPAQPDLFVQVSLKNRNDIIVDCTIAAFFGTPNDYKRLSMHIERLKEAIAESYRSWRTKNEVD